MEWFSSWWQTLGLAGQIMACAAISMSVVMILQTLLLIIGVGFGGEADGDGFDSGGFDEVDFDEIDFDGDSGDFDAGASGAYHGALRIFTIRGIVAFFAIGGWAGLAALSAGIPTLFSVQIALLSGAAAMLLASIAIRFALKMQSSGNIDLRNAVSLTADVYITIPPSRSGTGKVTMLLQERFSEIDAITDNAEALKPQTKVEVTGLENKDCLIVKPLS